MLIDSIRIIYLLCVISFGGCFTLPHFRSHLSIKFCVSLYFKVNITLVLLGLCNEAQWKVDQYIPYRSDVCVVCLPCFNYVYKENEGVNIYVFVLYVSYIFLGECSSINILIIILLICWLFCPTYHQVSFANPYSHYSRCTLISFSKCLCSRSPMFSKECTVFHLICITRNRLPRLCWRWDCLLHKLYLFLGLFMSFICR